ncbi:MAG: right-handed parallel beta-helix repeat-containing protein [Actinomycetota bacterium]
MARRRLAFVTLAFLASLITAGPAGGHAERPSQFPAEPGEVPTYRTSGPLLVVCAEDSRIRIRQLPRRLRGLNRDLLARCQFDSLQDAVDAVKVQGSRIMILPGVYREVEYAGPAEGQCASIDPGAILSYEDQYRCPHVQNLVAILGDSDFDHECDLPVCRLQIEGTGDDPGDVILDNDFSKLNGIRADRADGVYFRNFTVQRAEFNSLYVIETDGFVIDQMVARWNEEYGFLTFSSDHGLYVNCEAYGNGDGGVYPGSAADLHGARPSIEITGCRSHHNLIGYSGTAGNSTYVHDNYFYENTTGVTMDSLFPDHPGLPQDSATFVDNYIYSNNQDYYGYLRDGTCDKPIEERGYEQGVVCPEFGTPIGTGILVAGGNANTFANNYIYDNWRYGSMLFWVPAALRDEMDPTKQYDTSHFNRHVSNHMGISPEGEALPNGLDFWWDEEGAGNCWQDNVTAPGAEITSDPPSPILPDCDRIPVFTPGPVYKTGQLAPCATWSQESPDPPGCDWFEKPPPP